MTDTSFKQFQELLKPLQKSLVAINKRLGTIDGRLDQHDRSFAGINEKLDQHTSALINIEDTIKIYGDMYQINDDNARKLEKRIVVIEDLDGIETPPEFKLANF